MTAADLSAVYRNALSGKRLDSLRRDVQTPGRAGIREVAEQFEALFVQTMLKSMRQAGPKSELFGSGAMRQYRGLLDQQLALNVAHGQGMGLADKVERQMLRQAGLARQEPAPLDRSSWERRPAAIPPPGAAGESPRDAAPTGGIDAAPGGAAHVGAAYGRDLPGDKAQAWTSPEAFVRDIWPHAQRTAQALGVPPRALVAQAALETGWGQHVIHRADGGSSYNLFNIKAGAGWQGDRVRVPTLEYRDGVAVREFAEFRAYESAAAAFRDYAELLRGNPRYTEALRAGGDEAAFARALEAAGYATDPRYAEKIQRILSGDTLSALDEGLKKNDDGTTT